MAYLQEIDKHWLCSIQKARLENANAQQLQRMHDLSTMEFGYASNMRLRHECFWHTHVDKDGDVVLTFMEAHEETRTAAHVNVYIDHLAAVTTKDMLTGETILHEAQCLPTWILDSHLLVPFTESSVKLQDDVCVLAETGRVLAPAFGIADDAVSTAVMRQTDGLFKLYGLLHYGCVIHDDDISCERVLALYAIPFVERLQLEAELRAGSMNTLRVKIAEVEPVAYCVL